MSVLRRITDDLRNNGEMYVSRDFLTSNSCNNDLKIETLIRHLKTDDPGIEVPLDLTAASDKAVFTLDNHFEFQNWKIKAAEGLIKTGLDVEESPLKWESIPFLDNYGAGHYFDGDLWFYNKEKGWFKHEYNQDRFYYIDRRYYGEIIDRLVTNELCSPSLPLIRQLFGIKDHPTPMSSEHFKTIEENTYLSQKAIDKFVSIFPLLVLHYTRNDIENPSAWKDTESLGKIATELEERGHDVNIQVDDKLKQVKEKRNRYETWKKEHLMDMVELLPDFYDRSSVDLPYRHLEGLEWEKVQEYSEEYPPGFQNDDIVDIWHFNRKKRVYLKKIKHRSDDSEQLVQIYSEKKFAQDMLFLELQQDMITHGTLVIIKKLADPRFIQPLIEALGKEECYEKEMISEILRSFQNAGMGVSTVLLVFIVKNSDDFDDETFFTYLELFYSFSPEAELVSELKPSLLSCLLAAKSAKLKKLAQKMMKFIETA